MHTEQCKILLTFRLNAIDVLLILYFTMQAGMSQERKQEQLYPTVLGNATRLLQTLIYLKRLVIYQKHWSSKEERNWEASATNPRLRRGVGGEPIAPEAAGARRAGRGDGEPRHGALQRRHPSHPRRPPSLHSPTPNRRG